MMNNAWQERSQSPRQLAGCRATLVGCWASLLQNVRLGR